MEEDPTPSDPLAAFRIRRCLKCDYDFTGLPRGNTCPECGKAYTGEMLLLTGWSHPGLVAGTWIWWLRFALYTILLTLLLLIFLPVASSAGAVIWLAGLTLIALYVWRKVRQVMAGGNLRLLVTEEEIGRPAVLQQSPPLHFDTPHPPPKLGRELRRVRLKRYWNDTTELLVDASSWKTFWMVDTVRIVLSCSEDEAQALAHELRSRIAHAIDRKEDE